MPSAATYRSVGATAGTRAWQLTGNFWAEDPGVISVMRRSVCRPAASASAVRPLRGTRPASRLSRLHHVSYLLVHGVDTCGFRPCRHSSTCSSYVV